MLTRLRIEGFKNIRDARGVGIELVEESLESFRELRVDIESALGSSKVASLGMA